MKFPKLDKKSLTEGITIPHMVRVRQNFPDNYLDDPVGELQKQLSAYANELAPAVKASGSALLPAAVAYRITKNCSVFYAASCRNGEPALYFPRHGQPCRRYSRRAETTSGPVRHLRRVPRCTGHLHDGNSTGGPAARWHASIL